MSEKSIFIVAGEASGDKHAARLIREAKSIMPGLRVEGLGGEKMRQAGCELRTDLVSAAVMGFVQVIANIRFFRRLLHETVDHIEKHSPDAVVLVDYPGFNMRLASKVKKLGIPIIYYISPQVWAWRSGRINRIAELVDKMMVILPFEEKIYKKAGIDVEHVGHPLIDSISESKPDPNFLESIDAPNRDSIIGLLPGSRKQEITNFLPVLLEAARIIVERMPDATFLIPCSGPDNMATVKNVIGSEDIPVNVFLGKIHEVARASRCCIVSSGTATLEVACFLTPLIVVYKTGHLAWLLSRKLIHVEHISLVNIIAGKEVVPELLQYRMRPELLAETAVELCQNGKERKAMIEELAKVREGLGEPGASKRAAAVVCEFLATRGKPQSTAAKAQESLVATNG
jgi:lipid-A-disaccharide synthase